MNVAQHMFIFFADNTVIYSSLVQAKPTISFFLRFADDSVCPVGAVVFRVDKKPQTVKSNWAVSRPSLPTQNPTAKSRAYGWGLTFLPFNLMANCRD